MIFSAMVSGRHQPGSRIARHAVLRPLLQRRHEGVLRQLLGMANIANDTRQTGYEPRRFYLPNGFNGAMRIGSCHCYRSHHLCSFACKISGRPCDDRQDFPL